MRIATGGLVLLYFSAIVLSADKDPPTWTPAHSLRVRGVAEVTPSPSGDRVAWTETWAVMDGEKSQWVTHVFVARSDGSGRLQLTRGEKSASAIAFSPDGQWLLFASDRAGKRNLYRIPLAGGEAEQLTDWKGKLGNYAVSPDGKHVAFTAADEDKDLEKRKKEKSDWKVIDDKPENLSLWIMPLDGTMPGKPKRLVEADYHVGAFDWSPDSARVAFEHRPRPDADLARKADIAEVEVANGKTAELFATTAQETQPKYSPDGRFLLIARAPESRLAASGVRLALMTLDSKAVRDLATTPDDNPTVIDWIPDSKSILLSEARGTRPQLYRLPIDGPSAPFYSPRRGTFAGARMNPAATRIGFAMQSPEEAAEAYVMTPGSEPVRVSAANTAMPKPALGRVENVRWKAKDGLDVEGLLIYPAGYEAGKKAPLLLHIHGGPSGLFAENFIGNPGLYPLAAFAAKGYAILQPNPRGSGGYGAAFRAKVVQDWGGRDFGDLMAGVDHVIAKGVADPERLGVMGWSYGGYMTAWTVTQTSRFKAAAMGAAITNHVSMYGTQDIPSVYEDYFGGPPWAETDVYAKSSPINFVSRARTPLLILHGESDDRVPVTQGYEFYRAMKRQGVPVRMVVYPRQSHGPNEPKFQQNIMDEHLAWMDKHLGAK